MKTNLMMLVAVALGLWSCDVAEDVGSASECNAANHCHMVEGAPTCDDGYTWEDPNDQNNLRCIPIGDNCVPEEDAAFCARLSKNCDSVTADDNCGLSRTAFCGNCTSPQTCGGDGVDNVCGCDAESNTAFCLRVGKNCGSVTAPDDCGVSRTTNCGTCSSPDWCDGGGTNNICGCTGETDSELCNAAGFECGAADIVDRCGDLRTVSCGGCSGSEECGAWSAGVCSEVVCTGSDWCRAIGGTLAGDLDVRGIWGDGAGNAWTVASDTTPTGRMLKFDGVNWSTVAEGPYQVRAVTGSGSNLWAVSNGGEIVQPNGTTLQVVENTSRALTSVAAISSVDVWTAGYWGSGNGTSAKTLHYDGDIWDETAFGTWQDLGWRWYGMSAPAWNAVWVVGCTVGNGSSLDDPGPLVSFFDGVEWTTTRYGLPTIQYLRAVWAASANDVWAVGDNGTVLRYDGTWTKPDSGVSQHLYAVTGAGSDVWAAGTGGVLLKLVGNTWTPQQSGTSRTIRTLWANSTTDIWAGGDEGLLLHYRPN